MQELTDEILGFINNSPNLTIQIVETLVIILVLWIIRIIGIRILQHNVDDKKSVYKWRKNITYFTFFIGFLILGQVWFEALGSLGTFLGLLSAGIAIALKDPVTDIAAWLFLIWRKPFDIGDRIQIKEM